MSAGPTTRLRRKRGCQEESVEGQKTDQEVITSITKSKAAPARQGRNRSTEPAGQPAKPKKPSKNSSFESEAERGPRPNTRRSRVRSSNDEGSGKAQSEGDLSPVVEVDEQSNVPTTRGRGKKGGCHVSDAIVTVTAKGTVAKPPTIKKEKTEGAGNENQSEHAVEKPTEKSCIKVEPVGDGDDCDARQDSKVEPPASKRGRKTRDLGISDKSKATSKTSSAKHKTETESVKGVIKSEKQQTKRTRRAKNVDEESAITEIARNAAAESKKKRVQGGKAGRGVVMDTDSGVDDVKVELPSKTEEIGEKDQTNRKFVGAHCSIAGGLWNAVTDAVTIQAKSFALFLRSQRQWQAKPLEDENAARFREVCTQHGFPPHLILPHGSYLLNCGSPNPETLSKSRETLVDELRRCEKLGLMLYNFHPGSTCGAISVEECLDKIGETINMALSKTSGVIVVLENMSCQGNTVGGRFEELQGIIDRVEDKSRIGVCLDTCHAFAAGYDLSTESGFQQMTADFERLVGFKYLRGVHVNDSKGDVGCHLDRHENIGKGKIGLDGFRRLMNDPRFNNIPLILETPPDFGYSREIKTLNSLVD